MARDDTAVVRLPEPTSGYPVGRTAYCWTDSSRDADDSPEAGAKRELVVWVWYPASPAPDVSPAPYLPVGWERSARLLRFEADVVRGHAFAGPSFFAWRGKRRHDRKWATPVRAAGRVLAAGDDAAGPVGMPNAATVTGRRPPSPFGGRDDRWA